MSDLRLELLARAVVLLDLAERITGYGYAISVGAPGDSDRQIQQRLLNIEAAVRQDGNALRQELISGLQTADRQTIERLAALSIREQFTMLEQAMPSLDRCLSIERFLRDPFGRLLLTHEGYLSSTWLAEKEAGSTIVAAIRNALVRMGKALSK